MADLLSHLAQLTAENRAAVLATLVATEGARPRLPGAKLLIGADGATVGSVTLGGCVEARVAEAVKDVVASGRARVMRVDLSAEEAFDLGLSCSATLELLVEPVLPSDSSDASLLHVAPLLREQVQARKRAALVVRLEAPHTRLAVLDDGTTYGTLGTPALDAAAASQAAAALARETSTVAVLPVDDARVFIDVFLPPRRLFVFGAGPVSGPLLRFARELEMHTTLVDAGFDGSDEGAGSDARPVYAAGRPTLNADEVRVGSPGRIAVELGIGARDAVVIVAHDYKYEIPVLESVLRGDADYIGLLGSRRRGEAVRGLLGERGVPADALARVRVPAGLDVGAEAPAEIALAILAEIMALRGGRSGIPLGA
ncbi:MAG TPA: XdhC family protein [Longimicrobiales bacterium]|nr:XdhC family protein [Longimicrobiales bacterium]